MPRSLLALLLFVLATPAVIAQHTPSMPEKKTSVPATAPANSEQDGIAALQADLQRMRATLYQMQTNLAFVGNTATPLYHEFDLNIQMWQVMIAQMQRRVDRLEKTRGKEPSNDK